MVHYFKESGMRRLDGRLGGANYKRQLKSESAVCRTIHFTFWSGVCRAIRRRLVPVGVGRIAPVRRTRQQPTMRCAVVVQGRLVI